MITVVMTTWFISPERVRIAEKTLASWHDYLHYPDPLHLHIADDGSVLQWLPEWDRGNVSYSRQERRGVGASLNKGFAKAFETSPYVLYMVDDWSLREGLALSPWVELLEKREDVGMVRLGPPHPNTAGVLKPFTDNWQSWGVELDRKQGYAFGHRPALYHQRMLDYYGWYKEGCSAIDCEADYAAKVAAKENGPKIVYALPHPWWTEGESLSEVNP